VVELKQLGIYSSSAEANLVRARLQANGIDAMVQADSASGAVPQLEAYSGVKVLVRDGDFAEALEVLERLLPSSTD
jgi:type III secretory pathway lipoprotein EscJ